ncbi:MAG: ATP-binding protein, partial [Oscillospiraceae bacterium]|nr:ATP-binding protein [Oscillospiraceae bacterium]
DNANDKDSYYSKMLNMIRDMLSLVLKSNTHLKFAVLTGALRISKESIFTGLNNLKVDSVTDSRFAEYFGFTDSEVKRLLVDYDLQSHYDDFRECYDGYRFGETDIYCPWDVLNHSDKLLANPKVKPASHWINSSSNDLVRKIIDRSDAGTKDDIETLISGAAITKEISQELTYNEIETSLKSLWSVLLMTGYLTVMSYDGDQYELVIPNREVKDIYIKQIREWFTDKIHQNRDVSEGLYAAFLIGDSEKIEELLNGFLAEVFSVNDMRVANELKELYFHGMLVALLGLGKEWTVRSNPESGDGFVDVFVKRNNLRNGFVIEIKQTDNQLELEKKSEDAMKQLEDKEYATALFRDGVSDVWTYGIAFYKKRCKVIARHADSPKR